MHRLKIICSQADLSIFSGFSTLGFIDLLLIAQNCRDIGKYIFDLIIDK